MKGPANIRSASPQGGPLPARHSPGPGKLLALLVLASVFTGIATAFASGGGGEEGSWGDFLWRLINFIILVGAITWFLAKKVKAFLAGRRDEIRVALADAETARKEAEKCHQETMAKLERATDEIARFNAMLEAQGQAEKARLIEDAKKVAGKIKEDTQASMEQEFAKASRQLRIEAVRLSTEMAAELLKRHIRPEDHEAMVADYIEKVVTKH